ncbi:PREDICTED: DNA fragmentation factor subunit alpha-like [Nicrophorus vespilloides]|uniref:DNAation factor subunit alpha-like n=1 Tax=Nicrophorus vespilloides TaxID=110193 RepID=A0ABM1M322_NICVS|nr:PREDICTED: DNA fragmentation factor subunit alpha-like [Nicrophorus vespilloides]
MEEANNETGNTGHPFKVTTVSREPLKGVVATTLQDLTTKAAKKLDIEGNITVVLEADGTEIDDDEYFATLEPHTSLMILKMDEKWLPPAPPCRLSFDELDDGKGGQELVGLVDKLKHNLCHVSLLGGPELELLSDMDPDSLADITFPDKVFLEQLKEASGRYLIEKRQAQDAMDLLKLYHEKESLENQTNEKFLNKTD